MNITPVSQVTSPIDIQAAAKVYGKHSPVSVSTNAAEWFGSAEVVVDLKKALMLAINCGDFDKAIHILQALKDLK
jgi:hypothetical protein